MNNNKALVVEGGAMRGIFATGVLDAFIQANYQPFNQCYGVSAGATNIAAYLCAQYKRNHAVITDYSCRPEFIDFVRFIKGGHLFDLDWLWQETIRDIRLDLDTFEKQASEFYIVTTNIQTGQAEYLKANATLLEEQLKASCALPIAYREFPVINNLQLTDGGVADSIPIRKAYEMGNKEITVILSQPLGYKKKPSKAPWFVKRLYKNTPALAEATLRRAENYNQSIDFITNPPSDCKINIIAPPPNFAVGRTTKSFEKLSAGYEMGLNAGSNYLTQVA
ncbi:patatin family protein [Pseudoalteromonas shioyasakiensis]|uniref:Patatin family protein n=1 Tax=Pseudoalteromonas shioyasakiensis TaxID=1190813 RepID=A0ABT6TZ60_9GAMM|nr:MULTISPECIES: patatin family protein [Pseudoalteromonas]MDI4668892.1 patatin family protein [Pseudoalteromonas shioyasakiensis]MDI4674017.1 patatin family protein [Pseudoalteromonas shioyasakiensis]MDI4685434.1 patatin family protein [Pseudoalteromonas shioyasakiensis]MDI4704094.1 patatin family protein [Pseudoalteromonas shioyasakiensis]NUJ21139.1 patatin family protein [Pseudoalteromonas sp. 0802]